MKIKPCPICGAIPLFEKSSMDYGNGHGYPGNFEMEVYCPVCDVPKHIEVDDIYSDKDLYEQAAEAWNMEVLRIEKFMKQKDK